MFQKLYCEVCNHCNYLYFLFSFYYSLPVLLQLYLSLWFFVMIHMFVGEYLSVLSSEMELVLRHMRCAHHATSFCYHCTRKAICLHVGSLVMILSLSPSSCYVLLLALPSSNVYLIFSPDNLTFPTWIFVRYRFFVLWNSYISAGCA